MTEKTDTHGRILLTALGGRTRETRYELDGRTCSAPLTPLALVQLLEPAKRPDRVLTLLTDGARKTTWKPFAEGMREILGIEAEQIDIPDGRSAGEVRKILEKTADRIPEEVDLTLDVTQGYRHFPFLFYALALYLQSVRQVRIRGAYYGMVEGMGNGPCPIIDLRPLLELPGWFHAVQVFRDTGVTTPIAQMARPLAEKLRRQAREAGNDLALYRRAGSVERFVKRLEGLSQAYESGLPLELGHVVSPSEEEGLSLPQPFVESLPLAPEVSRMLREAVAPYRFAEPLGARGWKKRIVLDEKELDRQAALIDAYLERGQFALAVGLMREWVVSWVIKQEGREEWLAYRSVRKRAEEKLNALAEYSKKAKDLTEGQKKWGDFWKRLGELRNELHHHGMRQNEVKLPPRSLGDIVSFWRSIRSGETDLPPLGGGAGRLLISPQGNRPGVLFSALRVSQPDRCLVICSKQSRPSVAEAAQKAGFSGDLETVELSDPFAGYGERERIIGEVRRLLLEADEVVVNLTGGTTVMGIVAQSLVDEARILARPCRRLVLIDRRAPDEQEAAPYVESEVLWMDEKVGKE